MRHVFEVPTKDSSKQEEIAVVERIITSFSKEGQGSCLGQFFTKQLGEWLIQQIRYDFACDLYAAYFASDEREADLFGQLVQAKDAIEKNALAAGEALAEKARRLKIVSQEFTNYKAYSDKEIDRLDAKLQDSYAQKARIADNRDELVNELAAAITEVARLKVEIYDLTHKGEETEIVSSSVMTRLP